MSGAMEVKTKILIGDEDPLNLEFFDVMLSNLGFEIIKALDGEEALNRIESEKPDLILLDNILPTLSGWKITRLLKRDDNFKAYRDIPIIMFSALDDVKDKIEGFELGVEDYITKPFNFSEVLARIRAVLRHNEMAKQVRFDWDRMGLLETLNQSYFTFGEDLKNRIRDLKALSEEELSDKPLSAKETSREGLKQLKEKLVNLEEFATGTLGILAQEKDSLWSSSNKSSPGCESQGELEKIFKRHLESWRSEQEKQSESV